MSRRANNRCQVRKFLEDVSVWTNGCWHWIGDTSRNNLGYGCFYYNNGRILAHRYMWELINDRAIPNGMIVMHICDNSICVNPEHLIIGTQQQNIADMIAKDRANFDHPQQRLVTDDLIAMCRKLRRSGHTTAEISVKVGLGKSTVGHILSIRSRYTTETPLHMAELEVLQ